MSWVVDVTPATTTGGSAPARKRRPLIRASEAAPPWQRRRHILSGYRTNYTWSDCAWSLFRMHNQTINIHTHLFGLLYVLGLVRHTRRVADVASADRQAILLFLACAACCMTASVAYHLFGCMSAAAERGLLKLDVTGIVALIGGSFATGIFFAFKCHPEWQALYNAYVLALVCCGLIISHVNYFQKSRFWACRVAFYCSMVASGFVPLVHWCTFASEADRRLYLGRALAMFAVYIGGFVIYWRHVPELWLPGRFDLAFSSHQIWHVLVLIGIRLWYDDLAEFAAHPAGCDEEVGIFSRAVQLF